jgi:hypothetical protein
LDVQGQQITFGYVDDDGLVRRGQISRATLKTLRRWLTERCPDRGKFAPEGSIRPFGLRFGITGAHGVSVRRTCRTEQVSAVLSAAGLKIWSTEADHRRSAEFGGGASGADPVAAAPTGTVTAQRLARGDCLVVNERKSEVSA